MDDEIIVIHGDIDTEERARIEEEFNHGQSRLLFAIDAASSATESGRRLMSADAAGYSANIGWIWIKVGRTMRLKIQMASTINVNMTIHRRSFSRHARRIDNTSKFIIDAYVAIRMQNPEDPSDVLDGARLIRFHDDGNVAAVWDGTDTLSLHTVWDGDWYQTDSRNVSGQSIDEVDTLITATFD